jgi:hypothetical protein
MSDNRAMSGGIRPPDGIAIGEPHGDLPAASSGQAPQPGASRGLRQLLAVRRSLSGGAGKDPASEGADGSVRIEALQAALEQEKAERGFAECLVKVQSGAAQLALDFLVSEPDIAGFFRAFTKTLVEETNGHACGVWLIDEDSRACDLWMAYLKDRMFTPESDDWQTLVLPRHSMAAHLFS